MSCWNISILPLDLSFPQATFTLQALHLSFESLSCFCKRLFFLSHQKWVFFRPNCTTKEDGIRSLLGSLFWLSLLVCRLFNTSRRKRLELPFLEPFIMDPFMPGPVFCSVLWWWLHHPCEAASWQGIPLGYDGCLKSTSCPAVSQQPQDARFCICCVHLLQCHHHGLGTRALVPHVHVALILFSIPEAHCGFTE